MPLTTTWVIKLSKYCNMRCKYCYEWNELGDRSRMSLELWDKILAATVDHSAMLAARFGPRWPEVQHRNLIVFHGGEPLALPTAYLRQILERFDAATRGSRDAYQLVMQSNLYSVQQEKLELLRGHGTELAVSFDFVPGVRLNVAGQPTEDVVGRNIERLRAQGMTLAAIAVLAKHTVDHVTRIYDFFAERRMTMRILPLFDGPSERDMTSFWLDHADIRRGLETLFRHWIETGCRIPVYPLVGYFQAALRQLAGLVRPLWKRELHGDSVFIVNVDGGLYRVLDAYDSDRALGSLKEQSISDILKSGAYERSIARDNEEFEQHCARCEYLGACNGSPLYASRVSTAYEGRCPIAYSCISFMMKYVNEKGYGPAEIRALHAAMNETKAASAAVAS